MSNFFKIFEDSSFFSWLKGKKSSEQKVVLTRAQRDLIEELRAIHPSCLIRVLVGDLPTLIPSKNGLRKFIDPFRDLFEGLTVFDSYGNLVGGMAERWEEEQSGLTWKFFLRKNARWSDGRVITAHDFVWGWRSVFSGHLHKAEHVEDYRSLASLQRVLSKIFPLKNGLEILKGRIGVEFLGVRAVDKRILEIQLERPVNSTLFLSVLSDPRWSPLCEEYVRRLTDREDDLPAQEAALCASNGAFCLEHCLLGKEIELKKNPHYYAANKVFWPRVKYLLLHDAETRVRLWDSGYIDLYPIGEPEKAILEFDTHYLKRMKHVPANAVIMFVCNLRHEKLKKLNVRHAFNMLFRRHELRRFCPSGQWIIYGCLSLDDLPLKAGKPYWISFSFEDRILEARRLLQRENYSASSPLCLEVLHFNPHEQFSEIFLETFLQVPELKLSLVYASGDTCFERLHSGDFEICMYGEGGTAKHCLSRFLFYLSKKASNGVNSFSGYENARFDELVFSLYHNKDPALNQKEIYEELDKILIEDVPSFPWVLDSVSVLISDRILSASFFRWNYSSGAIYSKNLAVSEN